MNEITYAQAIKDAMCEEMRRDPSVFLLGEDIGKYGGAFGVTRGMLEEFGEEPGAGHPHLGGGDHGVRGGRGNDRACGRSWRSCSAISSPSRWTSWSTRRQRPATSSAARRRSRWSCAHPEGSGTGAAAQHSQSVESWILNVPGLKVVAPSTPADAKGLLKAAIRDDNPVVFLEQKLLYRKKGPVPDGEHVIPLGKADVKRHGRGPDDHQLRQDGGTLPGSRRATLAGEGIEAEVIDLRCLRPLDTETIIASAKRTGRVLIVHEACRFGGFGGEIAATICDSEAFYHLDAPIRRLAGRDVPIPYNKHLEAGCRADARAHRPDRARSCWDRKERPWRTTSSCPRPGWPWRKGPLSAG